MFLKLTTIDNKPIYINSNEIRCFMTCEHDERLTTLDCMIGTKLVKQRPEEIMEMLKGSN